MGMPNTGAASADNAAAMAQMQQMTRDQIAFQNENTKLKSAADRNKGVNDSIEAASKQSKEGGDNLKR
jgi:hypothetical protein